MPFDACPRIGCVGCVASIAVSNQVRFTALLQLLYDFDIIIAEDTKDVADTSFLYAAKQEIPIVPFITHLFFQDLVRGSIRARSGQMYLKTSPVTIRPKRIP